MRKRIEDTLAAHRNELVSLLSRYVDRGNGILQPHQMINELENVIAEDEGMQKLKDSPFSIVLQSAQEAIVQTPFVALALRPRPGVWEYVRVNVYELSVDLLSVAEYLRFKEELLDGECNDKYVLELDLEPFNATFPRPTRSSSIGNGVQFLNRHLSSIMFRNKESLEPLLDFLRTHKHDGHAMMLNDRIQSIPRLQSALAKAEEYLSKLPATTPYFDFEFDLQGMGFERGWGDTAQRVSEMVHLLLEILQAPDPSTLETFLGRIPMVFNVVIVSPHGYFGQANVLGLPDTGGQVVYILDQVRALENEMLLRIQNQGLDVIPKILIVTRLIPDAKGTTCNQRLERISGTEHTHILRVPFRTENGILRKWISRFDVWPYLETFAEDASNEIAAELQGVPDLIIGNYSDGNLVATLLGKTDFNAAMHKQQSMILVDIQTPGVHIKRPLTVFGFDDAPHGHAEVLFENVCVPAKNILLGEGRGFEIAQGRLGPGRLHHCMRLMGAAERGMQIMAQRALSRKVFGKLIAEQGSFRSDIAKCRIELEKTRLLVLEAADQLDRLGNKKARGTLAMAKVAAPNMALMVLDMAMQVHGAAGLSSDTCLAHLWATARTLRIADGPDEVHLGTIAKLELQRAKL
ncbi:PREDICTED: sucrose synthase 2-like [Prunus mume]|uniref:sucrose synthase n=2 Tax=Prunus mume TaxID=102107 RepID=A0ABM0PW30_PRUMU|nr:PREDICTED: sucrose synthase 2-like [Prunus mume]